MGKRCGNCANSTWLGGMDAVPEIYLKCEYVHGEPSNWKEKTMTNADRIRAMSDEELAKHFLGIICDINEGVEYHADLSRWLEWLKQPAEE